VPTCPKRAELDDLPRRAGDSAPYLDARRAIAQHALAAALFLTWAGSIVAAPLANTLPQELANPSVEAVESHPRRGLPNFFAKLKQGKDVRIAYFGGSITAQDGWRPKTLKWFQEQYPDAKVS
jgi:hypothetical protein